MAIRKWLRLLVLPAFVAFGCSGNSTTPVNPTPTPTPTPPTPTPPALIATLVGAGDIADCDNDRGVHAEATARLLDTMPADTAFFTAGDNAYFDGTTAEFNNCYHPRWGRHRPRTFPSPGNHDYGANIRTNGVPYFDYFGARAGDRGAGFYSYTLGNWHIISLNSNVPASFGSEQIAWLQNDLRANPSKCALAYWHHPLFTSGPSAGTSGLMRDVWKVLYDASVDVVVNGHDHLYERFLPQDQNGLRGPAGIVEYIVGTGGAPLYGFGPVLPNSVFKNNTSYGVLKLTLRSDGWDSLFVDTAGIGMDAVNSLCH